MAGQEAVQACTQLIWKAAKRLLVSQCEGVNPLIVEVPVLLNSEPAPWTKWVHEVVPLRVCRRIPLTLVWVRPSPRFGTCLLDLYPCALVPVLFLSTFDGEGDDTKCFV